MSITSAMYSGISGLSANGEAMGVIGNNISNANTPGFKTGRALFSDMLSATIGNDSQVGRGTQVQMVENIFGQSSFETTSNVTDLAIQGSSFFVLGSPIATGAQSAASAYYSRAGAFSVDKNNYLVNPDGFRVLDASMTPIQFPAANAAAVPPVTGFSKITRIDNDGSITYLDSAGAEQTHGRKIGVAIVPDKGKMTKVGGTLFQAGSDTGITNASIAAPNGADESISSNSLEQSNVDMATEFVKMILTQRAYSANSKTITTADEMIQEVLNLKR